MKLTEKQMEILLSEEQEQLNENNFYLKIYLESLDKKEDKEFIF